MITNEVCRSMPGQTFSHMWSWLDAAKSVSLHGDGSAVFPPYVQDVCCLLGSCSVRLPRVRAAYLYEETPFSSPFLLPWLPCRIFGTSLPSHALPSHSVGHLGQCTCFTDSNSTTPVSSRMTHHFTLVGHVRDTCMTGGVPAICRSFTLLCFFEFTVAGWRAQIPWHRNG